MPLKKNRQIAFRLADEEVSRLKEKINKSGLTQQNFMIKLIEETPVYCLPEIHTITRELRAIGNNLNQIARLLHQNGQNDPEILIKISEELNKIWLLLKQQMEKKI